MKLFKKILVLIFYICFIIGTILLLRFKTLFNPILIITTLFYIYLVWNIMHDLQAQVSTRDYYACYGEGHHDKTILILFLFFLALCAFFTISDTHFQIEGSGSELVFWYIFCTGVYFVVSYFVGIFLSSLFLDKTKLSEKILKSLDLDIVDIKEFFSVMRINKIQIRETIHPYMLFLFSIIACLIIKILLLLILKK